jgi:putative spermidine/putrescine transport system ATP-binding protein
MRAEIRRIHNELGATTIYVTHDQDEALSLADRIVVMREGEIRQIGTPRELYEAPRHLDVAEFMGFRNRLAGKVVRIADGRATVAVGGAELTGRAVEPLVPGANAILAVRPDDLVAGAAGTGALAAQVETAEYRGREFVGTARANGMELVFRTHNQVGIGEAIHLTGDAQRVLVFPAAASEGTA